MHLFLSLKLHYGEESWSCPLPSVLVLTSFFFIDCGAFLKNHAVYIQRQVIYRVMSSGAHYCKQIYYANRLKTSIIYQKHYNHMFNVLFGERKKPFNFSPEVFPRSWHWTWAQNNIPSLDQEWEVRKRVSQAQRVA